MLVLTETFLVRIHEVFALFVAIIPLLSLIIFLFYLFKLILIRSKKNIILLSFILFICAIQYTDHWISFKATPKNNAIELKVMTWNVARLGALSSPKNSLPNIKKLIIKLDSNKPDVVILQEISKRQIIQLTDKLNLSSDNFQWTSYYNGANGGLAILLLNNTSWILINKQITNLPPAWKCVFAEIRHDSGQTINVMGVHIVPPEVTDTHVKTAAKNLFKGERTSLNNILKRYVRQAKKQNLQINKIRKMVNGFNDPTIIAGDFNSTPQLPIHAELRKTLTDTWLEGGNGIGATRYWADIFPFRIDYIYTTNQFKVANTTLGDADFSDHKPVISEIFIEF